MAPVNRKRVKKKAFGPNAPKRGGRSPVRGTRYTRRNVGPENVSFVGECILPKYKKAKGWDFLKPEERGNVTSIANALIRNHIVTGTMKTVVINSLIELDLQGVIKLPPPLTRGRRKQ